VALALVDRFDKFEREGAWRKVRQVSAVLILKDGTELPVHSLGDPEVNGGLNGLNNLVVTLRPPAP
jgi:hypothetical protein